ncbi:dihydrofolate reductase family protein [Solirubrobacter sp. CPCC 204708]|uniref:Dihydrofolate reductase family protein n=1 Tax=Solirubrobacter deserti TaxID=2282478 RepID=A0ABT4RJL5_9ACTN|nr:dihydrofolate reductase family protein [Solirubrobacter deserti]MBE2319781.1 dihydrofolate reductase family protein [Solirubrobacter deserti]MDA0138735.1 dihydrofolate reductase family protein [Solirubrobacter deserti]
MRKLLLKMEMSLDGHVADSEGGSSWPLDFYDDKLTADCVAFLAAAGLHIMGRQSYEDMAPYWPTSTSPFAKPMNDTPKVVFSRSLEEANWPETRIHRGDLAEEIERLKLQDGGPIVVHGGVRFVQSLTRSRLIDEYRLHVHPTALGSGRSLFDAPLKLNLVDMRRFSSGTVAMTYTPG